MKLNFKEWNIVYEALNDKARALTADLYWQEEYEKDREESEQTEELRLRVLAVNNVIKCLETNQI